MERTSEGQLVQAPIFTYHLSLNPETRVCGLLNIKLPMENMGQNIGHKNVNLNPWFPIHGPQEPMGTPHWHESVPIDWLNSMHDSCTYSLMYLFIHSTASHEVPTLCQELC